MTISGELLSHWKTILYGPSFAGPDLKDVLKDISWEEAITELPGFLSIHTLLFHVTYYIDAILGVLDGGPLNAHDKFSFDHKEINTKVEWETFLEKCWNSFDAFLVALENMNDDALLENFHDGKYGTNFRNLSGQILHFHYHFGQISLVKKHLRLIK